jgi:hypothetical protein
VDFSSSQESFQGGLFGQSTVVASDQTSNQARSSMPLLDGFRPVTSHATASPVHTQASTSHSEQHSEPKASFFGSSQPAAKATSGFGLVDLLNGMNDAQEAATSFGNGPLLILAGAGSGKTRVLTHRIAYKLQQGVEAPRILAVTFTNKAAKEMKARLAKIVGEATTKDLWVGTFHSVCGRILRREIHHYQTPPSGEANEIRQWTKNFVIYDEDESMAAVKAAIAEQNLDPKLYVPKSARAFISECKNRLLTSFEATSKATEFKAERMARIYDSYESILARHNVLYF